MTSSETSSTPVSSQISRTRWKYPSGGGKQPPEFCTGSRNTAATVSGPSISIASAIDSAGSIAAGRYGFVLATRTQPGTNGSYGALIAGTPVIESAPIVVPWYAM